MAGSLPAAQPGTEHMRSQHLGVNTPVTVLTKEPEVVSLVAAPGGLLKTKQQPQRSCLVRNHASKRLKCSFGSSRNEILEQSARNLLIITS